MLDRESDRAACVEISRSLSQAFSAKDADRIGSLYDDKITIWHNHTNTSESKYENIAALSGFFQLFREVSYRDVRFILTEEGFVQLHVIAGTLASTGTAIEIPACLVVTVQDSRVVRMDEYGDPAPLLAALNACAR